MPTELTPISPVKIQGDTIGLDFGAKGLFAATASDTIDNSFTETNFDPVGVGSATLAAHSLVVGQVYRIRASGIISTV